VDSCLERIENVRKTGLADEIIIEDHAGQKIEDIQKYDIDIFTVGSDWVGTFDYLNTLCKVIYLERTPDISSTLLRTSHFQIVKVGIVGTGRIAARFMAEEKYVSGLNIIRAFNTESGSGSSFGKKHGLPVWTDDYEKFLKGIDAVYIASPNETHYEYARKAVNAGKHVLCEKPMCLRKEQAQELFESSRQSGLEAGRAEGLAEGAAQALQEGQRARQRQAEELAADFDKFLERAGAALDRQMDENVDDLRDLAIAIAEKVVCVSLKSSS